MPPNTRCPLSTRPTPALAPGASVGQSGRAGGTAARRDDVRAFEQFAWLPVGSVRRALSCPTHQYPYGHTRAVGRMPKQVTMRISTSTLGILTKLSMHSEGDVAVL
jgi:hypothetical protein